MPRGDRTGPMGQGPMTGRGAGYCAGFNAPGYANPVPRAGLGLRRGFGRGFTNSPTYSGAGRGFRGGFGRGRGAGPGAGRGAGGARQFFPRAPRSFAPRPMAYGPARYTGSYGNPNPYPTTPFYGSMARR